MKKGTKCAVAGIAVIALAAVWTWRYVTLNRLFQENYLPYHARYAMGEKIAYGENRSYYACDSEGYVITVEGREIRTFEQYAEKYGISPTAYEERYGAGTTPDAIIEVTVCIENLDDLTGEHAVALQEFVLRGDTWSFGVDGTLFLNSNPGWDPSISEVRLETGESVDMVLPFSVVSNLLPQEQWDALETTDMRLLVTTYPTEIDVCLNA